MFVFNDFPFSWEIVSFPNWRSHIFQRGILNHQRCSTSWMDPLNREIFFLISQLGEILTFWLNHYIMLYIYIYIYICIYIYIYTVKETVSCWVVWNTGRIFLSGHFVTDTLRPHPTPVADCLWVGRPDWRPGDSPCGTFRMVPSGNLTGFNGDFMGFNGI